MLLEIYKAQKLFHEGVIIIIFFNSISQSLKKSAQCVF